MRGEDKVAATGRGRRRRYRLAHPERLLGMVCALLVIILAVVLLAKGHPGETKPQNSVNIIEESRDVLPVDAQKAPVDLSEIGRQLRAALLGMLGDNADNYGQDPESQPDGWQQTDYTYCVVLDAGHGGEDPGNELGHTPEKDINLAMAKLVKKYINQADAKVRVVMLRDKDEFMDLETRRAMADVVKPDLIVCLHCNAYPGEGEAKGVEALYSSINENEQVKQRSLETAEKLTKALADSMGLVERAPLTYDEYPLLYPSEVPGAILEMGFLSDPGDDAALNDPAMQEKGAEGIGKAILTLLNSWEPRKSQEESGIQ